MAAKIAAGPIDTVRVDNPSRSSPWGIRSLGDNTTTMDETIEAVADPIKTEIANKVKSNFFGAWALSFFLLNWKTFYILLFPSGDLGFLGRIELIGDTLYDSPLVFFLKLAVPLVIAILNMVWIPKHVLGMEERRYRIERLHLNAKARIDEEAWDKQLEIEKVKGALENEKRHTSELKGTISKRDHRIVALESEKKVMIDKLSVVLNESVLAKFVDSPSMTGDYISFVSKFRAVVEADTDENRRTKNVVRKQEFGMTDKLAEYVRDGLVEVKGNIMTITTKGYFLYSQLIKELNL
jgi:hypothetical protein